MGGGERKPVLQTLPGDGALQTVSERPGFVDCWGRPAYADCIWGRPGYADCIRGRQGSADCVGGTSDCGEKKRSWSKVLVTVQ